MTIDNRTNEPTPEQILWELYPDDVMDHNRRANCHLFLEQLRANGLLFEGTPSEAQVEAAARALFEDPHMSADYTWAELVEDDPTRAEIWRIDARRTLTAAAGVAPQPVIDEAALAEVIADAPHSGDSNVSCLDPRCKAAAVAAWLREGVAPQEPSQNETKSGNNLVSLDPEKVAEVLLANAKSRYGGLLFEERAAARIARALCEAYTEGKLTK